MGQTVGPYASLNIPTKARFARAKVNHHVDPVWVGMGCILGGALAMPAMAQTVGVVAVEQGRREDYAEPEVIMGNRNGDSRVSLTDAVIASADEERNGDDQNASLEENSSRQSDLQDIPEEAPRTPLSRRQTIAAARTSPALSLHKASSRSSYDPFGQLDDSPASTVALPSRSSPTLPTVKRIQRKTSSAASVDVLLQRFNIETRALFLQGHYSRTEVRMAQPHQSLLRTHPVSRSDLYQHLRVYQTAYSWYRNLLESVHSVRN